MKYGADYAGARFYKADLQIQTPGDTAHWEDAGSSIAALGNEGAAEAFVQRCYEVGLEIVGITDHNFLGKEFLPFVMAAANRLATTYGWELTIFPGFEIQANVGRGCHVIALFEPGTDLEDIDHLVTECGVARPRIRDGQAVRSTRRLSEILEIVQRRGRDGRVHGLVILPHAQAEAGIFDTDRIAEWLQQQEFTNPDLLCVEVPKPVATMSEGWQRLFRAGEDCLPEWRRRRPIAQIMSSDAKRLEGTTNYVGWRHTWIKLSSPSIEGLRQAFLDPQSRLKLQDERPEDSFRYPAIRRLRVENAGFLADTDLSLSMNLNSIIGGGGTGKSTIIEYLRIALGQQGGIAGDAAQNLNRLRETIAANTTIEVQLERDGREWLVRSTGGAAPDIVGGDAVPNLAKFFPVRVVSQREIFAIADDPEARTRLLDGLIRDPLDELGRRADDLVSEIKRLDAELHTRAALVIRRDDLQTELQDAELRLANLTDAQADIAEWRRLLDEGAYLDELSSIVAEWEPAATEFVEELTNETTPEPATDVPHAAALVDVKLSVENSRAAMAAAITAAAEEAKNRAVTALDAPEIKAIRAEIAAAGEANDARRGELLGRGIDPDSVREYQTDVVSKRDQLVATEEALSRLTAVSGRRAELKARLDEVWRAEARLRLEAAARVQASVPNTRSGRPFIEVLVEAFGDMARFREMLRRWLTDRRRMTIEQWDGFIDSVAAATPAGVPPSSSLRTWLGELRAGNRPAGCPWSPTDREAAVLLEWMDDERMAELDLMRVPDRVSAALFRADGTRAGELERGLSIGQRCTAVLAILLARDDVPIIIDQPEDDIDNEFTYRDLVPLIRSTKENRQLIVTTHDPNIPVNGDAELIIALEARDARGVLKTYDTDRCVGALDQLHVQRAVEDIMEGSEDAFRRRYEKYGF